MNAPLNPAAQRVVDRDDVVVAEVSFERLLPSPEGEAVVEEIDGELRYEAAEPYAVTLVFHAPTGPVRWTVAREILLDGCFAPAGDGDVRVEPCLSDDGCSLVLVELRSPDGIAMVTTPTQDVVAFGQRALARVAPGLESSHLDLDGLVDRLLRDA